MASQLSAVWVSGLETPVDTSDVAKFFSRLGSIEEIVPVSDDDSGSVLLVFVNPESVTSALDLNGRNLRDSTLSVSIPTESQLHLLNRGTTSDVHTSEDPTISNVHSAFAKLDPASMLSVLEDLMIVAKGNHSSPPLTNGNPSRDKQTDPVIYNARSSQNVSPVVNASGQFGLQQPVLANRNQVPVIPHVGQFPKIAFFSGDLCKAGEVKFWHWRSEITSLLSEGYSQPVILQSIRRSLRGTAAEVMQNLKSPCVEEVLDKFDMVFGMVLSNEDMLSDYYNTSQKSDESIVAWSCRLESILSRLVERNLATNVNEMKRSRFWHGLINSQVKESLRHRFERGDSFQNLFIAARSREHEFGLDSCPMSDVSNKSSLQQQKLTKASVQVQQTNTVDTQLTQISKQLASLQKELNILKTRSDTGPSSRHRVDITNKHRVTPSIDPQTVECFYCHDIGHFIRDCPKLKQKKDSNLGNGK